MPNSDMKTRKIQCDVDSNKSNKIFDAVSLWLENPNNFFCYTFSCKYV